MPNLEPSFDYIIVGAGSAGCVLANRLSADSAVRVCLVEAGPEDRSVLINTPLGIAGLLRGRRYNWAYETQPQAALRGRRLYWPRGKALGGSSSINAMIYMRGHPGDYDDWAAEGNPGWGWQNVLPIFVQHERQQHGADALHGGDGPLCVHDLVDPNPLSLAFVEAGVQAGLPRCSDFNGPAMDGAGLYQVTQHDGRRWSAARAFLDPIRQRPNLAVRTECLATRVLFEGRRAVGLRVRGHGRECDLSARREVILCGGAVNSPQLLMLSGLGPGAHLQAMGIATVADLPGVGANLQDHLDVTLAARDGTAAAVGVGFGTLPRLLREALKFRKQGCGMLTSNAAEAGGFARTRPGLERPDVQFHFLPTLLRDHGRKLVWGYGYTLHVCQLRPQSRGRITLASPDPGVTPRIDPMYLSHAEDLGVLRAGLRLAHRILSAPAWQAFAANRREPCPDMRDGAALDAYIRGNAETIYHPVGTCRMGADDAAVVDSRLRVRGVGGLRVADASIMPNIIGGNTNAPCMMIGEMASRFVAEDAQTG
ncbi:alcohol dehydrogenase [mine drainage metagenome]|uniref:Alcohol dehydrogenase n=1 Tax=mine drainage metagenome TaxID=410659 RepID=A0A1J5RJ56_9ZZZZ